MKQLGSILFLISACSASVEGGGDDTSNDVEDEGPGAGNATVRFRLTTIHDERGDLIEFSTGEPVHTHAGAEAQLGAEGCTEVYKYSYLMDAAAPKFGRETTPNPLAWKIEAKSSAEYRVRASDATVVDWTPIDGDTIALHRDVITSGEYFLDVRAGEAMASTCITYHPLAAPVELQSPRALAGGLVGMTLPLDAPISSLLAVSASVPVFEQRFVHHTAEPVTLVFDVPRPSGSYTKRVVDGYLRGATGPANVVCSTDGGFVSDDPICTAMAPPLAESGVTTSGALASGVWSIRVVDEGGGIAPCTVADLRATCHLPARATTEAAKSYRLIASVTDLRDVAPAPAGPFAEHTVRALTYTGQRLETTRVCAQFAIKSLPDGSFADMCKTFEDYTHVIGLDHARIAFAAIPFGITASPTAAQPGQPLAHVAPALRTMPAFVWDAGDDGLPGS